MHEEMIDKFVNKDDEGNRKRKKEGVNEYWDFSEENLKKFEKEYTELMEEEFVIEITPSTKEKIKTVKELVLTTEAKFGPGPDDSPYERDRKVQEAIDYANWCDALDEATV